jgi:hypothetical protein
MNSAVVILETTKKHPVAVYQRTCPLIKKCAMGLKVSYSQLDIVISGEIISSFKEVKELAAFPPEEEGCESGLQTTACSIIEFKKVLPIEEVNND